jgi:hypothetical protein
MSYADVLVLYCGSLVLMLHLTFDLAGCAGANVGQLLVGNRLMCFRIEDHIIA